MRRRELLGAAGVLGVGGCLRLEGGDGTTDATRSTRTVTGTPTTASGTETTTERSTEPDTETETTAADYPVGLSESDVDPLLADGHGNALVDQGFSRTFVAENVTSSVTKKDTVARVEDDEAIVAADSDITMYTSPDGRYWRQPVDDRVTYGQHWNEFNFGAVAKTRILRILLEMGSWRPPTRNDDGSFTITTDGIGDATALRGPWDLGANKVSELKSFSATGTVTTGGVVTEFESTYQFVSSSDDRLLKWRVQYGVSDVGTATVTEPEWYQTALDEVPEVAARLTDDGFVEARFEDGNRIEAGSGVGINDDAGGGFLGYRPIREPIEPGTTLYLWIQDDELRWERDSKPSTVEPASIDGRLNFQVVRANAFKYFPPIPIG